MQFKLEVKEEIIRYVGEVLKKAYGEDYPSVLPMFADTDCPMPEVFKDLTENQNKQLEDRFLYCITEAAMKDTFGELQDFLKSTLEKLRKSYSNLREAGYKWLVDFPCDDKSSFLHFGVYLTHASIFGIDAKKFYLKFTYTQKHSKKRYDVNGTPLFHSLYSYSPVASSEYVPDIFTIKDYGEQYIIVANLYKDIIYVLDEAYKYVMSVDQQAAMRKLFPTQCQNSLSALVKEVIECLEKITPDQIVPTPEQIQHANDTLPSEITEMIFTLSIPKLSTTLYHEILTKYKFPFGILANVRITQSQGMEDVEYLHVFKHIKDSKEKFGKAIEARLLLAHIDEFTQLKVRKDGKMQTENLSKGQIACLFYLWTGTEMSQSAFVKDYYCVHCVDEKFHVAQNTLSTAYSKLEKNSPLHDAFANKANEIIRRYKENNATRVSMKKGYISQESSQQASFA